MVQCVPRGTVGPLLPGQSYCPDDLSAPVPEGFAVRAPFTQDLGGAVAASQAFGGIEKAILDLRRQSYQQATASLQPASPTPEAFMAALEGQGAPNAAGEWRKALPWLLGGAVVVALLAVRR